MNDKTEEKQFQCLEKEIHLIHDDVLRESLFWFFNGNDRFLHLPSSLSGKYHPPDERSERGLRIHTQRTVWWVLQFLKLFPYAERYRDELIAAACYHDIGRMLVARNSGGESNPTHGNIGAWFLTVYLKQFKIAKQKRKRIVQWVFEHMSHWDGKTNNSIGSRILSLADYCASRSQIVTPIL